MLFTTQRVPPRKITHIIRFEYDSGVMEPAGRQLGRQLRSVLSPPLFFPAPSTPLTGHALGLGQSGDSTDSATVCSYHAYIMYSTVCGVRAVRGSFGPLAVPGASP
jgi:hypothetical protein